MTNQDFLQLVLFIVPNHICKTWLSQFSLMQLKQKGLFQHNPLADNHV